MKWDQSIDDNILAIELNGFLVNFEIDFTTEIHQLLAVFKYHTACLGPPMNHIPFIMFAVPTNAAARLMFEQGMLRLGLMEFAGDNIVLKVLQVRDHQDPNQLRMLDT